MLIEIEGSLVIPPPKPIQKICLHVGCGPRNPETLHPKFRSSEWSELRLDIDPNVSPDVVSTITSMPMVMEESVDAVWSSHNLEHLFAHEVTLALKEFYRVLRTGGFALITLPDLQEVAKLIAEDKLDEPAYVSAAGPIAPLDMLYGFRPALASGNHFMAHRTGFTAKTLKLSLELAGFPRIEVQAANFALWAYAYK